MTTDIQSYQIRIEGQLDQRWTEWFYGITIINAPEATETMLVGYMADQAALYGLLNQLRDLNLTLIAVERLPHQPNPTQEEVMNPEQIRLIQQSFGQLQAEPTAALFYQQLFALDPTLQMLFRGDMHTQGRKLMTMLAAVVNGLPRLETLLPAVKELGRKHTTYGVCAEHYNTVGTALLWTLAQELGEAFTPPVQTAWATAYGVLAEVMQQQEVT